MAGNGGGREIYYPPEKDVVDLFPNESPQAEEFAVYPVQNGLEKISLPWVLTIKQF